MREFLIPAGRNMRFRLRDPELATEVQLGQMRLHGRRRSAVIIARLLARESRECHQPKHRNEEYLFEIGIHLDFLAFAFRMPRALREVGDEIPCAHDRSDA
jgi:hypothetical protein